MSPTAPTNAPFLVQDHTLHLAATSPIWGCSSIFVFHILSPFGQSKTVKPMEFMAISPKQFH